MKHLHFKLLLAMLALSAAQVHAVRYTNKTQISFRPQGVNMPMEQTLYHRLHKAHDANNWNGKFQASVFYQQSESERDLARLLLYNKADSVSITRNAVVDPAAAGVDMGYIIHSRAAGGGAPNLLTADANFSLKLAPERKSYGLNLGYEHDLSNLVKGLHFQVSTPIVHIEHRLNRIVTSAVAVVQAGGDQYFTGKYQFAGNNNNQDFLKKALLVDQRAVGIADVELELNYDAIRRPWGSTQLGLGVTVPTGNRPDGTYAFQPVVGNNHHVGVGTQGKMVADVLSMDDHELNLHIAARYRYLLQGGEVRTLGIKGRNFGQYHLLAKTGDAQNAMLRPAANELTLPVVVTPGHQFDASASLAYSWNKVSVDLGYGLYFRNKESVRLQAPFADDTYAVVARNYNTNNGTAAVADPQTNFANNIPLNSQFDGIIDGGYANGVVNNSSLDFGAATDEAQLSHTLFASLGLAMNQEVTPVILGIGGSYEFANNNNALEQWTLWAKAGISF